MNSDAYNLRLHSGLQLKFCSVFNNSIFLLKRSNGSYFKGFNVVDLIINSLTHTENKQNNSGIRQNKPPKNPLHSRIFN